MSEMVKTLTLHPGEVAALRLVIETGIDRLANSLVGLGSS